MQKTRHACHHVGTPYGVPERGVYCPGVPRGLYRVMVTVRQQFADGILST